MLANNLKYKKIPYCLYHIKVFNNEGELMENEYFSVSKKHFSSKYLRKSAYKPTSIIELM